MKLGEAIEAFLSDVCAGKANETPAAYRTKLKHLERYLGADCERTCQAEIDAFRRWLLERTTKRIGGREVKGKLSIFTVRSVLSTTRHFLRWCCDRGHLPRIQLANIKEPKPDPKAIDETTVTRMLLAVPRVGELWEQARNLALMYVLIDTGSRAGCVARMEVQNLRLAEGWATAIDKGDNWSWLYFNPPTSAAISAWLEIRYQLQPQDDYLWTGARGKGINRQGIYRVLERLADAAGVKGQRHNPHSFRHAFAREAILSGASLNVVAELLNHRGGIVVTHKYYARWTRKETGDFHKKYSPGRKLPEQGSAKP